MLEHIVFFRHVARQAVVLVKRYQPSVPATVRTLTTVFKQQGPHTYQTGERLHSFLTSQIWHGCGFAV